MTRDPRDQGRTRPDEQARQYLLGALGPDEQARVEQQYFVDDSRFDDLQAAEEALIDEYLHAELAGDDRARFQSHFLASPERKRRVDVAAAVRAAARSAMPSPHRRRGVWQWLPAAAAVAAIAIGGWAVLRQIRTQAELDALRLERQALAAPSIASPPIGLPIPAGSTLAVALRLDATRGAASAHPVQLLPDTEWVHFVVDVTEERASTFSLVFRGPDGVPIRRWDDVQAGREAGARVLTVAIAANLLRSGDRKSTRLNSSH